MQHTMWCALTLGAYIEFQIAEMYNDSELIVCLDIL